MAIRKQSNNKIRTLETVIISLYTTALINLISMNFQILYRIFGIIYLISFQGLDFFSLLKLAWPFRWIFCKIYICKCNHFINTIKLTLTHEQENKFNYSLFLELHVASHSNGIIPNCMEIETILLVCYDTPTAI